MASKTLLQSIGIAIAIGLLTVGQMQAHPGHDEISVLVGTVVSVNKDSIELEVFYQAALINQRVSIVLQERTKFRLGKNLVKSLELTRGQRIEAVVRTEDMPDGSLEVRALEIKASEPKKTASVKSP